MIGPGQPEDTMRRLGMSKTEAAGRIEDDEFTWEDIKQLMRDVHPIVRDHCPMERSRCNGGMTKSYSFNMMWRSLKMQTGKVRCGRWAKQIAVNILMEFGESKYGRKPPILPAHHETIIDIDEGREDWRHRGIP